MNAVHTSNAPGAARILGTSVQPLVPLSGPVHVLLVGEAPGPRGADKSGVPFFGDAAGRPLYDVLRRLHAVALSGDADAVDWDGATLRAAGYMPTAHGIALGNAYDRCPTDNGVNFRTPTRRELEGAENIARLTGELAALASRGLRGIVTMGRVATRTMDVVLASAPMHGIIRRSVAHPSAQGLLSMAPERGRGAKMVELQAEWRTRLALAIVDAGFVVESRGGAW